MAFSVNTNAGALEALRNLNSTNTRLSITQNRINTGLEVGSARDDAATYAIAQNLRADIAGLNSVRGSIDRAQSSIDVALAAGEAVSDLLIDLRELAVAASDAGLDSTSRTALNDEFTQTRDQINSIVNEATFNGTNAVVGTTNGQSIVAITNDTGTSSISIAPVDLTLTGLQLASTTISGSTGADATTAVTTLDNAISTVNTALSNLGAGAIRLDLQANFTQSLSDSIEVGIGNLVDADLARESAELQALQVQQQLGLQALSIANQAPQSVLSLFG